MLTPDAEKNGVIRQIARGCGDLPHVGEHPGTVFLWALIAIGALAGAQGGLHGALFGSAFMALFFAPMYLFGAYERANISDQLEPIEQEDAC